MTIKDFSAGLEKLHACHDKCNIDTKYETLKCDNTDSNIKNIEACIKAYDCNTRCMNTFFDISHNSGHDSAATNNPEHSMFPHLADLNIFG